MPRKKSLFIIDQKRGVIRGNFHEFKSGSDKALRKDLCTIEEADYKTTARGKKKRNESERANYLLQLYEEKKKELEAENTRKEAEKDKSRFISYLFNSWLSYIKDLVVKNQRSKKTLDGYQKALEYYLDAIGDHEIEEFNQRKIQEYLKYLEGLGSSLRTQYDYTVTIQSCFNWCAEEPEGKGFLLERAIKIKLPNKPKIEPKIYSKENILDMLQHVENRLKTEKIESRRVLLLNQFRALNFSFHTGCRGGEVWALSLENIDFNQKSITIESKRVVYKTKSGDKLELWRPKHDRVRVIPITSDLSAFLKKDLSNREAKEKYFLDDGTGRVCYSSEDKLRRAIGVLRDKVGAPKVKPLHGIRAYVITRLLEMGFSPVWVQHLVGHEDIQTTLGYMNKSKLSLRTMIDSLAKDHKKTTENNDLNKIHDFSVL